jgi:YVTN family beta-propeller protein
MLTVRLLAARCARATTWRPAVAAIVLALMLLGHLPLAHAADPFGVIATIPVSEGPLDVVAVNPATNRIFAATSGREAVAVIDGATNSVIAQIPLSASTSGIGVNAATNRIYVSSHGLAPATGTVTVIDGSSDTVLASVPVGVDPTGIAVDAGANRVYTANFGSNSLSVLDGATNRVVADVPLTFSPGAIEVNPGHPPRLRDQPHSAHADQPHRGHRWHPEHGRDYPSLRLLVFGAGGQLDHQSRLHRQ